MVTCAASDCEVEFEPYRGGRPQRYCSHTCRQRQWNRDHWHNDAVWRETTNRRAREIYSENPETARERWRRWRAANPEKERAMAAKQVRNRMTYRTKAQAYDRIVEVGGWWTQVKQALEQRTEIPEPPMASLEDIAV